MRYKRALRYLAPNLITTLSMIFGMLSLVAAHEGRYVDSGWLIVYAVLSDRLDGFVARLVRGSSELGVQLDSFADFLNFCIAPAFLIFTSLGSSQELPFREGGARYVLLAACCSWILGGVFRLARYNITTGESKYPKVFFGVPTTMCGGLLVMWYLALLKYSPLESPMYSGDFGGMKLFGDGLVTPESVWRYFPVAMFVGAYAMASSMRMPKLGLTRSKSATAFVFANVFLGYVFGFARLFPEYNIWPPTAWLVVFLIWGKLSPAARAMTPPPLFPSVDPPPGQEPIRPEDDLLPEHADEPLDQPVSSSPADDLPTAAADPGKSS